VVELRQIDLRGEHPVAALPYALLERPRLDKLDRRWLTTISRPNWFAELEERACAIYP
jgi:hypothetical protein